MSCYLCNQLAEFSCRCAFPNMLICNNHLNTHKADKHKRHTLDIIEDTTDAILFKDIKDKIIKITYEIVLISKNQIKQIKKETKHLLCLFNKVMQRLNEKYLEKELNTHFLNECVGIFADENDRQRFRNCMRYEQIVNNNNIYVKTVTYDDGNVYEGEFKNDK